MAIELRVKEGNGHTRNITAWEPIDFKFYSLRYFPIFSVYIFPQ